MIYLLYVDGCYTSCIGVFIICYHTHCSNVVYIFFRQWADKQYWYHCENRGLNKQMNGFSKCHHRSLHTCCHSCREFNDDINISNWFTWNKMCTVSNFPCPILKVLKSTQVTLIPSSYVPLNSLWPGDAIWRHRSGSTLAQVMACCLMAPGHYWTNVDLSSVRYRGIHLGVVSLQWPNISVIKVSLNIIYLKLQPYCPWINELIIMNNNTISTCYIPTIKSCYKITHVVVKINC